MTLDQVLDEALAWFEAYRRVGFTADEVFFGWNKPSKGGEVWMVLEAQGRSFIGICGPWPAGVDEGQLMKRWHEKAAWWNVEATDAERDALWERGFPASHAFELIRKLQGKGFDLTRAAMSDLRGRVRGTSRTHRSPSA